MAETLDKRVRRAVQEDLSIVPYNPAWPVMFEVEKQHLLGCLPHELIGRIEHFGSTAVPGLAAKPIIDMLVEVTSIEETQRRIAPLLEAQGYDYFWRPTRGEDTPPFYAWFIKRDEEGIRTHHVHMVEGSFEHWDRLLFRDFLIRFPSTAREYEALKRSLAEQHPKNRVAYSEGKTPFIERVTGRAKEYFARETHTEP
jgi:GrpB-like predicted nucleotidyltransferase (UPF0157 family)